MRLQDTLEDCSLAIEFERFVIWEFGEVESKNLGIWIRSYTFMTVKRQLDGALLGPSIVCQREVSKNVFTYVFNCTISLKRGC